MEDNREVCLEEEVWRLRRAGLEPEGISSAMGVDLAWIEQVLAMLPGEETSRGSRDEDVPGRSGVD